MNFNLQAVMAIQRVHSRVGVHHIRVLHLNINWFAFGCSTAIIDPIRNDTKKIKWQR